MRARIVPATADHARALAANARPEDVREFKAVSGSDPLPVMLRGIDSSVEPLVALHDGEPVCMFGAAPWSILGGIGAAWMVGSQALDRRRVQADLLRLSPLVVDYLQDQFPALLYNFVDQRNTSAIRWLRWLGFQFGEEPVIYGVERRPFLFFYRKRGD